MTEEECLRIAEDYLSSHTIEHMRPGRVQRNENEQWETVFLTPEASAPSVTMIDPPDVWVWKTLQTGEVQWLHQMQQCGRVQSATCRH